MVIAIANAHDVPARARGAFLTIGNFDGVHRGHQRLLACLRARADAAGAPALAVTFDPHPAALLRPDRAPTPLVWPEREIQLLREAGATEVAVFQTGPWLLDLSAREFFERMVRGQFAARGLVEGPNFAFGHDRRGDVAVLRDWCADAGMDFEVVEELRLEGEVVSSSLVRNCLREGNVEAAARFLGRPHRIRGAVVSGDGRGAGLGFPTANLGAVANMLPADGVYAVQARIGDVGARARPGARAWPAACNLGTSPTFQDQARKVEAHLIGFQGDLYGQTLELDFVRRLRAARRFDSVSALREQIQLDVDAARRAAVSNSP